MTRPGSPKPASVLRGFRRRTHDSSARPPRRVRSRQNGAALLLRRSPADRPPLSALNHPKIRLIIVWAILMLSLVGLAINLLRLQVLEAAMLQERAMAQQIVRFTPPAPRRPIVDRRNTVVAVDRPVYILYAHPMLFKQSGEAIAAAVAPIINRPSAELIQLFRSGDSGLEVSYGLPEDMANRIRDLGMDGLELIKQEQRLYPQQDLLGEVLGFVNAERQGQAGVEYGFNDQLQLSTQEFEIRRTGMGAILPTPDAERLIQSDDLSLRLTVDSRLQRIIRSYLRETLQAYSAKRGAVMVMNVQDGAMLALVTEPTFDPNLFFKAKVERDRNWAISDLYEPGSTFKTINMAIALESGAVKPTDTIVDEGQIIVGEWPIQNSDFESSGGRGEQTLTQVIQNSSNVGMVRVMQHLKAIDYYTWLEKIGLGEPVGVDLPFETAGTLKDKDNFLSDPVELATTAFGQGFSLTPIQMLQLQSTLANGGMLVTPHVVEGLYDPDGKQQWTPDRPAPRRIFSTQTAQAVLQMMETVVDDGTGTAAQVPGYRVAGKTGTAQKASATGGYDSMARVTSFVSLFPSDAPRYGILVVIDEPQGDNAYGGTVAAPLAKRVMEAMITTLGIPPSRPDEVRPPEATLEDEAPADTWEESEEADTWAEEWDVPADEAPADAEW